MNRFSHSPAALLSAGLAVLAACLLSGLAVPQGQEEGASLQSLRWILGEWGRESETATVIETWQELSPEVFRGAARSIHKSTGGIEFAESLLIVKMGGNVFYLAKVPDNPFPIAFRLASDEARQAVFENLGHDFPQQIGYRLAGPGRLEAWISGPSAEGVRRKEFHFALR